MLRQKISEIVKSSFGVSQKAQMILIILGEKPALEFESKDDDDLRSAVEVVEKAGLKTSLQPNERGGVKIIISKEPEMIEELKNLSPDSEADHKRYGQLMGFPESAIETFSDAEKRLDPDEQSALTENMPHFFGFSMSKEHHDEELEVLKRWNKQILDYAPELYDELYPPEESERLKKNVSQKMGKS